MRFRIANTDGRGVNVRPSPDTLSAPITALAEGTQINGDEHAWRSVTDTAGKQGFIADELLVQASGGVQVGNTGGFGANMRAQPDTAAPIVVALPEGAPLAQAGEHAWRRVMVDDTGRVGWVADDFLTSVDVDVWSYDVGSACGAENYWDADGQPNRKAAMLRCNQQTSDRRRAIFEAAMESGLTAEGVTDASVRQQWKLAMRMITLGDGFPGECPDLNPFMLAGEVGGVFRGGADALNSSALGYFQFIAQKPIPIGTPFSPQYDYGHWKAYGPCDDYAHQTEPTSQVREFIRAVRASARHQGDPMSVVRQKQTPPHVWGP